MEDRRKYVFVLGDSRTGTTSIHKFLQRAGYNSIHYFNDESGIELPAHVNREKNWDILRKFINESAYNAFSDYPTRLFYRELFENYPDAKFIHTHRTSVDVWKRSMLKYFGNFNIELNIENKVNLYEKLNSNIIEEAKNRNVDIIDICIDDNSELNGSKLVEFLDLPTSIQLGYENASNAIDNKIWSSMLTLYNTLGLDKVQYAEGANSGSKSMLSEFGWLFLVNDSSDFLQYLFGQKAWSQEILERARNILINRNAELSKRNIAYFKFVVPEKSSVYMEYLPKIFAQMDISEERPAVKLVGAELGFYHYLFPTMVDAKSYGLLYFRGDSHANWLGAFFIYNYIITEMNKSLKGHGVLPPVPLRSLTASLAAYGGDLYAQMNPDHQRYFAPQGIWGSLSLGTKIEHLVKYVLPEESRKSANLEFNKNYSDVDNDRPIFVFENSNKNLPRAVIFRDSTSDYIIELLAEHFSYCIFIWHKGYCYKDIIEQEKPDVVLHIMAERFVVQYQHNSVFNNYFN